MLAYEYPLLGIFWTALFVFLWIAWLLLVFRVIIDIFRSPIRGAKKALWALLVVVFPLIGVFAYLIVHGDDMAQRDLRNAEQSEEAVRQYVRAAAGPVSVADELVKLAELRTQGVLSDEEFEAQKAKLLATT
ncbi:MAG: SHOCT domain-containing protein [Ilumatobacter sp.]|jgi:hypothetical protein|uniref:SHOCT domain-containing protein n=1 Tax=Ilumatobacter sp. TaxID=1967498 RepID=UPI0039197A42